MLIIQILNPLQRVSTETSSDLIVADCCEEERIRSKTRPECGLTDLANRMIERMKVDGELVHCSKVKSYAPHVYHYVFDIEIKPL